MSFTLLNVVVVVAAVLIARPAAAASWDPVGVVTLLEASGDVDAGTSWTTAAASTLPVCASASREAPFIHGGAPNTGDSPQVSSAAPSPVVVLVGDPDDQDLTPFVVMAGPTPYAVASGAINASVGTSTAAGSGRSGGSGSPVPWAAAVTADVDGDGVAELVLVRATSGTTTGDVVVVKLGAAAGSCGGTVGVWRRVALPGPATPLVGLAVLPAAATAAVATASGTSLVVARGVEAGGTSLPVAVVSFPPPSAVATTPPAVNVTRLCLPSTTGGTVTGVAAGELGSTTPAGEHRVVLQSAGAGASAYATIANVVIVTSEAVVAMAVTGFDLGTSRLAATCSVAATAPLPFTQATTPPGATGKRDVDSEASAALVSASVTCLAGDGLGVLVLLTDAATGDNMHWLADNGTATLQVQVQERIDASGQSAAAAVAVPWLTNAELLATERQLVVLRAKPTTRCVATVWWAHAAAVANSVSGDSVHALAHQCARSCTHVGGWGGWRAATCFPCECWCSAVQCGTSSALLASAALWHSTVSTPACRCELSPPRRTTASNERR